MEGRLSFSKVSNLSLWSGMSENGVKLYEKEGIITPERDEANGYRKLSISDGDKLFRSRILSAYGYSVKDIAALLKEDNFDKQHLSLEEKSRQINSELIELSYKLKYINDSVKILDEIKENPRKCIYVQRIRRLFLPVHDQFQNKGDGDSCCSLWFKAIPYITSTVYTDSLGKAESVFWYGPAIDEIHAVRFRLPTDAAIKIGFESQQYVRGFSYYPLERNIETGDYSHLKDFAFSNGKELSDCLISSHLLIENTDEGMMTWDEVLIPVK